MRSHRESLLAADIAAFLKFKRALGCQYTREEFTLRAFDRYVSQHPCRRGRLPLGELIRGWLGRNDHRKPVSVGWEHSVLRQFALFLRRSDPSVPVPPRDWAPPAASTTFLPYVLTMAEVKDLLRRAAALSHPAFRGTLYPTLILVLYCTGLRFGEALRLRLRDVDLTHDVLFVAAGKGRARWIPFHPSLGRRLMRYLVARRAEAPSSPEDRLFVGKDRVRLRVKTASSTLRNLFRAAGIKPAVGRVGPRPYDLRHTFAVHRLTRWYRAGVSLEARMPWLSAYMGHDDLLGTEKYLHATPELLQLAARRLKRQMMTSRRPR